MAPIRSSLPLQMLFFFNGWYDVLWVLVMLALYIWKSAELPYPPEISGALALEITLVFVLAMLEYARLFLGSRGNKTEQTGPLLLFALLSAPALTINLYYLLLQVYVTRLDVIMNAISISLLCLELVLALLTILNFMGSPASGSS